MAWQVKRISIPHSIIAFMDGCSRKRVNMAADPAQFEGMTVSSDDLDLVHASKKGDVAAFEQLVKRYDSISTSLGNTWT